MRKIRRRKRKKVEKRSDIREIRRRKRRKVEKRSDMRKKFERNAEGKRNAEGQGK